MRENALLFMRHKAIDSDTFSVAERNLHELSWMNRDQDEVALANLSSIEREEQRIERLNITSHNFGNKEKQNDQRVRGTTLTHRRGDTATERDASAAGTEGEEDGEGGGVLDNEGGGLLELAHGTPDRPKDAAQSLMNLRRTKASDLSEKLTQDKETGSPGHMARKMIRGRKLRNSVQQNITAQRDNTDGVDDGDSSDEYTLSHGNAEFGASGDDAEGGNVINGTDGDEVPNNNWKARKRRRRKRNAKQRRKALTDEGIAGDDKVLLDLLRKKRCAILSKKEFRQLVKKCSYYENGNIKWTEEAVDVLQEVAELELSCMFSKLTDATVHAKRKTTQPADIELYKKWTGLYGRENKRAVKARHWVAKECRRNDELLTAVDEEEFVSESDDDSGYSEMEQDDPGDEEVGSDSDSGNGSDSSQSDCKVFNASEGSDNASYDDRDTEDESSEEEDADDEGDDEGSSEEDDSS